MLEAGFVLGALLSINERDFFDTEEQQEQGYKWGQLVECRM